MDPQAVLALLPHGPGLRMVDTVEVLVPGESATATWRVPVDAWWVADHFPGHPILPGALLVEALAQVCALVWLAQGGQGLPVLVGVEDLRLRAPVRPDDVVVSQVRVLERRRLWRFEVGASVQGRSVVSGALVAAVAADTTSPPR